MYKALIRAQQAKNTSSAPKIHYLVSSKMKSLVALACPNQNHVLLDLGDVSILYLYNLSSGASAAGEKKHQPTEVGVSDPTSDLPTGVQDRATK
jgi:hypothetical protein